MNAKRLSLAHLTPEDALRKALTTPPPTRADAEREKAVRQVLSVAKKNQKAKAKRKRKTG
jgi:hypothetical protein